MKNLITGIIAVGAILGVLAFFGLTPFGKQIAEQFGATAPANSTNGTQKQLLINGWNLANSTSTSVLNNLGFDISASELQFSCAGVGSSQVAYTGGGLTQTGLTLKAATTSTSFVGNTPTSNTAVTNTNTIVSTTLSTTSPNTIVASTTPSIAGNIALDDVIPNGTYVTFYTNATNTAVCNIGVQIF